MTIGKLLERAMQLIVAMKWHVHRTGEVTPEMEAEARETLAQLYGAKQEFEPDELPPDEEDADSRTVRVAACF